MKMRNIACAAGLALATSVGFSTANAAPIAPAPIASPASGMIETVGHRKHRGLYKRHGITYYNGYRGHRHYRHGYRHFRGHYFPRRAFTIHIYVGPRYVVPRRHTRPRILRVRNRHVSWCYSKYRSYRASDNTFQPYHGHRKRCRSPYAR